MDFLKKHYEKVLLGVVLVGLMGVVGYMLVVVSNEQQKLNDLSQSVLHPHVTALSNIDLTMSEQTVKRAATPVVLDFGPPGHRLFNPSAWQRSPDGHPVPRENIGPRALVVTNITPLYFRLSLDKVEPVDNGFKYVILTENQAAANPSQRHQKSNYCKLMDTTDVFQLIEVRGKPDDPTELVVKLKDSGDTAVIKKDKPFERIDGYMADLHHPLESRPWLGRRVGSSISFNGEDYTIVGINQNEVVLSAKSNGKKWTIKTNAAPS
jgi:hypothetical protein